ncbi:MAG: NTP transferase domain-containing protein [Gemmatimonadales bacterium]
MMHGLILAGGDGSRLLASGVTEPKALVSIGGQPQLRRAALTCFQLGCRSVTCAIRAGLAADAAVVCAGLDATIVPVQTTSSLHTLVEGLRVVPPGQVFCTLVDTVMPTVDWVAAHRVATGALRDADAVIAVTPFVDDTSPLWVEVGPDGSVRSFGQRVAPVLVTGGVYWLGARARLAAAAAVASGVVRLRGFLSYLIDSGLRVRAVEVCRIIDVDTRDDLVLATALMRREAH